MSGVLERLRGGLIVSVQAEAGSAIGGTATIVALARAAVANGAAGLRIEGGERIAAVVRAVDVPVIGLVKRAYPGSEPYISPTRREIAEVLAAGAPIVAFDATLRPRRTSIEELIAAIAAGGALAMADCAAAADGIAAYAAEAALVATTLCGYTEATRGAALPALELVAALRTSGGFVVCEGGVGAPAAVAEAFEAGADAVVVGTALTNVDANVRRFVAASPRAPTQVRAASERAS